MTYFIAAPLLYKEVVLNNLAIFFLGVDDDLQPHHFDCQQITTTTRTRQTRLCHSIVRKDGTPYKCCRHLAKSDIQPIKPGSESGIFHKQQLLQLVQGVHFVYSSADVHLFAGITMEDYLMEDGTLDKRIFEQIDLGRHMNVPECIKSRELYHPLPNLKRLTIASWLAQRTNVNEVVKSDALFQRGLPALEVCQQFERQLASLMYQFTPPFVCHYPCDGFLRQYPAQPGGICVNTIHEAEADTYAQYLVIGAQNLVHFEDVFVHALPQDWFEDEIGMIAWKLVETVNQWYKSRSGRRFARHTDVWFVVHRSRFEGYSEKTKEEEMEDKEIIEELKIKMKEAIAGMETLPEDWSDDIWDIEWAEDQPACPACCPEYTDDDLYAVHLESPAISISVSPPSTP
jgi:hypothetical protein